MIRAHARWVAGGAVGVVIMVCAAAAAAASSGDQVAPRSRSRPPRPRVTTLGVSRSAALISYCWQYSTSSGLIGQCADGAPGPPTHTLYCRPGVAILINLRVPGSDVHVSVAHIYRSGRYRHDVALTTHRRDFEGRRWAVKIPRSASRSNVMFISARYAQGDMGAELGIRQKR